MRAAFALALLLAASASAAADSYQVGDLLSPMVLEDQFGETARLDRSTHVVVFSHDMDGGKLLKAAFADTPAEALRERGVVYLSDVSGMPRLVTRLFALPAMRERPYRILIDADGSATKRMPEERGQATLLFVEALRISSIAILGSADTIRSELGFAPTAVRGEQTSEESVPAAGNTVTRER